MTVIEIIGLISGILGIISFFVLEGDKKLKALAFLVILSITFILGKKSGKTQIPENNRSFIETSIYRGKGGEEIETEILRKYKNIVKREKKVLTLMLKNGKTLNFKNRIFGEDTQNEGEHRTYTIIGVVFETNKYIVDIGFYENNSTILIDMTDGEKFDLAAEPVFSPNFKRFSITDMNEMIGSIGCWIYELRNDGRIDIVFRDDKIYPSDSRWIDNNNLEIICTQKKFHVRCQNGSWKTDY